MKTLLASLLLVTTANATTIEVFPYENQPECVMNTMVYVNAMERELEMEIGKVDPWLPTTAWSVWEGLIPNNNAMVVVECDKGVRYTKVFGVNK